MTAPNERRPFVESLESRQLFAATTPALPDLVPTLTFNPPAVVAPGTNIAPVLKITNAGASLTKKATVPIRLYISPTRTLSPSATPFKTIQQPLNLLQTGQSSNVTLTSTLPASINSKRYFLIVKLNNREALAESNTDNNTVVSPRLHNPLGTYAGKTTTTVGSRPGTLSLSIKPGPASTSTTTTTSSLLTDLSFTADGLPLHITSLKSKFSSKGVFHIHAKGVLKSPTFGGHAAYNLAVKATLSDNKTLTGTIHFHWQSTTDSRNTTSTFTLTRQ